MREKHFERTGKLLLLTQSVASIFILIGLFSQLAMSGMKPIFSIIPLVLLVVCYLVCMVCYRLYKSSVKYVRTVAVTFSVLYFAMLVLSSSNATFPYMIPFLLLFVLAMDKVATRIASCVFVAANFIRIIITIVTATAVDAVIETVMIEAIITILVFFAANKGQKLLIQFFHDSVAEVEEKAKKNKAVADKIVEVTAGVELSAEAMAEALETISGATERLNDSMDSITRGTSSTAEAIGGQTNQTREIQAIITEAHSSAQNIVQITEDTKESLAEGTIAMNNLFEQVGKTIASSGEMQETSKQLQDQTEQVRGITNIILSISNQTNLLALNASIEAARAGESGRGFSVVADEIRNLADQTRQETENITALIDALSVNAKAVISQVDDNVATSEQENEYARTASGKFELITQKIEQLSAEIADINQKINALREANNRIVENVNTLSETSRDIDSTSQDAKDLSNQNVQLVKDFSDSMENILAQVQSLQNYTQES